MKRPFPVVAFIENQAQPPASKNLPEGNESEDPPKPPGGVNPREGLSRVGWVRGSGHENLVTWMRRMDLRSSEVKENVEKVFNLRKLFPVLSVDPKDAILHIQ
jgi:hypothetical protein